MLDKNAREVKYDNDEQLLGDLPVTKANTAHCSASSLLPVAICSFIPLGIC